jgi:hypothetical protein
MAQGLHNNQKGQFAVWLTGSTAGLIRIKLADG